MKNNKGVTLTMLVIIIIVLLIITGVSVNTSITFMNDIRVGRIVANMELIQAKVETIYEEYQFQGENKKDEVLVGTEVTSSEILAIISNETTISDVDKNLLENNSNMWYKWDLNVLKEQRLDEKMLDNPNIDFFWVNYENSKIIYSKGTIIGDTSYFSKDALEAVLAR